MDIAAFVISLAAIAISVIALRYAKRQTAAQEWTADASMRSAAANEETLGHQRAEVDRNRVRFVVNHVQRSLYELRNDGTDTAYGVGLDLSAFPATRGNRSSFSEFPAGHAETFIVSASMNDTGRHVTITWHHLPDRSDQRRSARCIVPR